MNKLKKYDVMLDVSFIVHQYVKAKNKGEAFQEAKKLTCYGEGEELTLFEIKEI